MKQVLQYRKTVQVRVVDVPTPQLRPDGLLVRNSVTLISAGTMRASIELSRKSLVLEWLERQMDLAADRIVTVGHAYREQIAAKVPVGDRISVVMNGVDAELFSPSRAMRGSTRSGMWRASSSARTVGTIRMAHGLEVVIRAARILQKRGRSGYRLSDRRRWGTPRGVGASRENAGINDQILFTGRMSRDQIPTVLASSDACLVHLRKTE